MSNTNWKFLGRKQGANMKNNRNVKSNQSYYNNGKWDSVYSDDDIKRLAYYNIDLPHVVGIGTQTPFSKLSFGDSSNSGYHPSSAGNIETSTGITAGKLSSIALHEVTRNIENQPSRKGQEFNGLGYVTNLRSVRNSTANTDAKGIGLFSNKFSPTEDTSQKTDQAILYITDDKHVQIGGVPTGYNLIDRRAQANATRPSFLKSTQETGPNIILDVSGSIHVNGFINFLKYGANTFGNPTQDQDNPANQLTLDISSNPPVIKFSDDISRVDNRAAPEGSIFVGWDKDPDGSTTTLKTVPRLYIMVNGIQKRIATEDDSNFYSNTGGDETFPITGSDGTNGGYGFYIFRNNQNSPGTFIMNTFSGITDSADFQHNEGGANDTPPKTHNDDAAGSTEASQSLILLGGLSVFDATSGGTNGVKLKTSEFRQFKQILVSEIYQSGEALKGTLNNGKELGSIYTDRHLMIGGFQRKENTTNGVYEIYKTFNAHGSAIDISGGTIGKPAMRVITGPNKGSIKASDPRDSIIIGNTDPNYFSTKNAECILVGENTKYENNENTLVMGNDNKVTRTKNSLIVGNNLDVSFNSITEGVVALGHGVTVSGNDRIVFATKDADNNGVKALAIDYSGNVTIEKNLNVLGNHVHLEVQNVVAEDKEIELNAIVSGSTSKGAGEGDDGGLCLFTSPDDAGRKAKFSYDKTKERWTTAKSTVGSSSNGPVGLAVGDNKGNEQFVVKSNKDGNIGDLHMGTGTVDKFVVEASTGNVDISGILQVKGGTNSNVFSIANGSNSDITIAPNGSGTLKVDSAATITSSTDLHTIIEINGGYGSGAGSGKGATFDISQNPNGDEVTNLKITGKLHVDGDIDPTALILTDNSTPNSYPQGNLVLYNENGTLKFRHRNTDNSLSEGSILTSSGGVEQGGTIESSNKIKVEDTGTNQNFELVFCDSAGASGANEYEELKADRDTLTYNPGESKLNIEGNISISKDNYKNQIGYFPFTNSADFIENTSSPGSKQNWGVMDSSKDGMKLVAVANLSSIYYSSNGGASWALSSFTSGTPKNIRGITMSSTDGKYVALVANSSQYNLDNSGNVWTSSNYGQTFTKQTNTTNYWTDITSDSTGQYLYAVIGGRSAPLVAGGAYHHPAGKIYYSDDYGSSWNTKPNSTEKNYSSIAMSSDAKYIAATSGHTGYVHISSDSGTNWTSAQPNGLPTTLTINGIGNIAVKWVGNDMTYDGKFMVAVEQNSTGYTNPSKGRIWISTNYGQNWSASGAGGANWASVTCSGAGNIIIGAVEQNQGTFSISDDSGSSWVSFNNTGTPVGPVLSGVGHTISETGLRIALTEFGSSGGNIWTRNISGALSSSSTAIGYETTSYGQKATTMGSNTLAMGDYSTAMGSGSIATGDYSTVWGYRSNADGDYSTAMGNGGYAGENAIGDKIQFAIGASATAETDVLALSGSNHNAFVILENKNVGIGTDTPTSKLEVDGNIKLNGDIKLNGNIELGGDAAFTILRPDQTGGGTDTNGADTTIKGQKAKGNANGGDLILAGGDAGDGLVPAGQTSPTQGDVNITGNNIELNGTVIIGGTTIATAAELNLVLGSSAGTIVNNKAVIYNNSGEVNAKGLNLDKTDNRIIKIDDQTVDGIGKNLTIQGGKAKNANGGNLILSAGLKEGGGTEDGDVKITGTNIELNGSVTRAAGVDFSIQMNQSGNSDNIVLSTNSNAGIYLNTTDNSTGDYRFPILFNGAPLYKTAITEYSAWSNSNQFVPAKKLINGYLISNHTRNIPGQSGSATKYGFQLPSVSDVITLIQNINNSNTAIGYMFHFIWDTSRAASAGSEPDGTSYIAQNPRLKTYGSPGEYVYRGAFLSGSRTMGYMDQASGRVRRYECRIRDSSTIEIYEATETSSLSTVSAS